MENRLVDLEVRVAFQEDMMQQLNDVIVRQQRQIDQLAAALQSIKMQLQALSPSLIAPQSEETPPPHY